MPENEKSRADAHDKALAEYELAEERRAKWQERLRALYMSYSTEDPTRVERMEEGVTP